MELASSSHEDFTSTDEWEDISMWRTVGRSVWLIMAAGLLKPAASEEIVFKKHTLDLGRNETCAIADINGDGKLDVVAGENWYEAPGWKKHKFRTIPTWRNYIDNFSDLPLDVNADGAVDIISVSWNSRKIAWFENPGSGEGVWKEHLIDSGKPVEFAFLVDLDNDGKAEELLPQFGGGDKSGTAWYELSREGAQVRWIKHTVSEQSYGHGIGAGDVDGDGRNDILTPKGWLQAPQDPRQVPWKFHPEFDFQNATGFIHVYDVNQDGLNGLITGMAHDYGVVWMRQSRPGPKGEKWTQHTIDDAWSQAHALTLADLNGDGRLELLTGKRLFAHNGHDKGGREPLGLYWYEYVRMPQGWEWVRHIIHYGGRVGGGMQIPVSDMDGDGDLDFVVAGKGGVFLFENRTIRVRE